MSFISSDISNYNADVPDISTASSGLCRVARGCYISALVSDFGRHYPHVICALFDSETWGYSNTRQQNQYSHSYTFLNFVSSCDRS